MLLVEDVSGESCCNNPLILLLATPACPQRLALRNTSYFNFVNGSSVTTGRVEVCVDGIFYPVCVDGLSGVDINGVCSSTEGSGKALTCNYIATVCYVKRARVRITI